MKNKDYRLVQLKYKLKEQKNYKVKYVIWRLTSQQKSYIESLGYKVTPYLYEIRTRTFKNLSKINNNNLKQLHYSCKRGKKTIVLSLNSDDIEIFKEYKISFRPIKYKILLIF